MPLSNTEKQKRFRDKRKRDNELAIKQLNEAIEKLREDEPQLWGTCQYMQALLERIRA